MSNKQGLKIVIHNSHWFQGALSRDTNICDYQDDIFARLMQTYRLWEPNVLCLQEIQSRELFDALKESLRMHGHYTQGVEQPKYGGAVLVRSPVKILEFSNSVRGVSRMWQKITLKLPSGLAMTVCNLHLPSTQYKGREAPAEERFRELLSIIGREPPPQIVVGDFNEVSGGKGISYMHNVGYRDVAVLNGQGDKPTTVVGLRIDYIFALGALAEEVTEYSVFKDLELKAGRGYLSDHYPVCVNLALKNQMKEAGDHGKV